MKKAAKITFIWQRTLMIVVFLFGLFGMIFNKDQAARSEYLFICVQSGLFLIVSLVPIFINKLEYDVPDFIYIFFICFCLAHFFCGEILDFFVIFKWWDSMLHTLSGMLIALLSFSLINIMNKNVKNFNLSMGFAILFAFSMAITIGVIWEIIEFAADSWFGLNMQRAYVSTLDGRGEPFVGQRAVLDTMKDLILDSIGALFVCVICAIFAYKKKLKVEDFSFIKKRKKFVPASAETNTEKVDVLTFDAEIEERNTQENLKAMEEQKLKEEQEKQKEEKVEEANKSSKAKKKTSAKTVKTNSSKKKTVSKTAASKKKK